MENDAKNLSDRSLYAGGSGHPSSQLSASFHLCVHDFSIECVSCPEYDECPYPDRSSSLMSVVVPAGITLLSLLALLTFILLIR